MNDARVGIVGVGLIGGSLALALKQAGYDGEIVGCDVDASASLALRCVDRLLDSPTALTRECDVVVLATPVGAAVALLAEIAPACSAQTVITDAGSTKRRFVEAARAAFDRGTGLGGVVPGHPIAGCEKSGAEAARADLFRGRKTVLTPLRNTDARALGMVTSLWERAGAEVTQMDAVEHDALFAATSHLPHLLAYALIGRLLESPHRDRAIEYAAGGLRDFTRIAESDPVMWRDICLANRDNLLEAIAGFESEFGRLRDAVGRGDAAALDAFFKRAGDYRRRLKAAD